MRNKLINNTKNDNIPKITKTKNILFFQVSALESNMRMEQLIFVLMFQDWFHKRPVRSKTINAQPRVIKWWLGLELVNKVKKDK